MADRRCCCGMDPKVGCAVQGLISIAAWICFFVSAIVFTVRFNSNTVDWGVANYNALSTAWQTGGSAAFSATYLNGSSSAQGAATVFTATVSVDGASPQPSSALLGKYSGFADSPPMQPAPGLDPYPASQNVQLLGISSVQPQVIQFNGLRLDGNVTISAVGNGDVAAGSFSMRLPVAYKALYPKYCRSVGKTTVCSCPMGTEDGVLCASWYKLTQICMTVRASSGSSGSGSNGPALAGEPPGALTPGCAVLPRVSYLSAPIPVPQTDECLVVGSNGMSVGAYEFWSSTPVNVATLPSQLSVTIRSDQDPWVFGMSSGATDGTGVFGQSASYQYAVLLAMWVCTGICVASCCCLCCLPSPCCRPCVRGASRYARSDVSDAVELACCPCVKTLRYVACIGEGAADEFDDVGRCSGELRSCCGVGLLGFAIVGLFVAYETFAGLALTANRNAICASKTLACAGRTPVTVQLSCTPVLDLRGLGGDAATFWSLQVASIVLYNAGLAIMLLLIMGSVPFMLCDAMWCASFIWDNLLALGSTVILAFVFIGSCLQVGTAVFASSNVDGISGAYCDSLRAQGITPTACAATSNVTVFPQLAALFGMLLVLPLLVTALVFLFPSIRGTLRLNSGLGALRAARRRAADDRRMRLARVLERDLADVNERDGGDDGGGAGDAGRPAPPIVITDRDAAIAALVGELDEAVLTEAERREQIRRAAQHRRELEAEEAAQADAIQQWDDNNPNQLPARGNNRLAL